MKHLDFQQKDFSQQFTEQIKCLESKVAVDTSILSNILDLYKRRAAIEHSYAENLLKLTSSINQRNNLENTKRPKWKNYSPVKVLHSLLVSTEHTARAHKNLGDIYGKQMTQRIMDMQDDCVRLTKRSTDILQHRQLQIIQSIGKLLGKQKTYSKLFNEADEYKRKADKALDALDREVRKSETKNKDLDKNYKIKKLKEDYLERFKIFKDKYIECATARNKYIIHFASLKEILDHFYNTELKNIIQCSQYGFHNNLTRLTLTHNSCEEALSTIQSSISNLFSTTIDHIDAINDMQVFVDNHDTIFVSKERLRFTPAKEDTVDNIIMIEQKMEYDLKTRRNKLDTKFINVSKIILEKQQKLNEASNNYNELISQRDYDVLDYVCHQLQSDPNSKEKVTSVSKENISDNLYQSFQRKVKEPKLQKEITYFKLIEEYLDDQLNLVNVTAKLKHIDPVMKSQTDYRDSHFSRRTDVHKQTAIMVGMKSKLFGGDLKKYCWETKETVPLVIRSCIRLINVYGMQNVGVFRVPGSQYDVQIYKNQFELGADPFKNMPGNTNEVNVAASLLKLYFRELNPPVFDEVIFTSIVAKYNAVKHHEPAIVDFLKDIMVALDPAVYATITYLVSFLSHLSEFSSTNCMDIANLAIIFGPCLMPIPEDKNSQLFHYQAIVNHVAQCLITYNKDIFTKSSNGPVYQNDQSLLDTSESIISESLSPDGSKNSQFFEDSMLASIDDGTIRSRNQSLVYGTNLNTKSDEESSVVSDDSSSLKDSILDSLAGRDRSKSKVVKYPSISEIGLNMFTDIVSQDPQDNEIDAINQICIQRKDSDTSSICSSRNIEKQRLHQKMSLGSMGSEYELECRNREESDNSPVLDIPSEFADMIGRDMSASVESISFIEGNDNSETGKESLSNDNNETGSKVIVNIRKMSQISPMSLESMDNFDEELLQTRDGLQKFEELNVQRIRNTIHFDDGRLASKFLNPIFPDPMTYLTKESPLTDRRPSSDYGRNVQSSNVQSLPLAVDLSDDGQEVQSTADSMSLKLGVTGPPTPLRLHQN